MLLLEARGLEITPTTSKEPKTDHSTGGFFAAASTDENGVARFQKEATNEELLLRKEAGC